MSRAESRAAAARRWYAKNRRTVLDRKAERYREDPEACKSYSKKWRQDNPEHSMLLACRKSARERGHGCDLTLADVRELTAPPWSAA